MFDQVDGVAMGSPLSSAYTNLFVRHYESKWLESNESKKVFVYKRYVTDIFCILENKNDANSFLLHLNEQHPNIKFTI